MEQEEAKTVRESPHESRPVTVPQFFPCRRRNAASVSRAQPHTFTLPVPPQVSVPPHVPHATLLRAAPQLSLPLTFPQFFPSRAQKAPLPSGVQPHTFAVPPPPHVVFALQLPHATARGWPQRSVPLPVPQATPSRAQNCGFVSTCVQEHAPAWQEFVPEQVPHVAMLRCRPQESNTVSGPQLRAARAHNAASVSGVQPQTPGVPPPPHVPEAQVPHATVRGRPQWSVNVRLPQAPAHNWASLSGWHTHWPVAEHASPLPHEPHTAWRVRPQLSVSECVPHDFPAAAQTAASESPMQTGAGVTQTPRQRCVPMHTSHAFPFAPQASAAFPTWQALEASQQPAQFEGPHGGFPEVVPQAVRKRARQHTKAEGKRSMPLCGNSSPVFEPDGARPIGPLRQLTRRRDFQTVVKSLSARWGARSPKTPQRAQPRRVVRRHRRTLCLWAAHPRARAPQPAATHRRK